MKNKITNPFITGGYISPNYFCNRIGETKKITDAIISSRNLTLISLRRMGKTGLLKHVKYQLDRSQTPYDVIYVDLLPTTNSSEMLNSIYTALFRVRKSERNFIEKMMGILASLRPSLTMDPLTGEPSVQLKVESPANIKSGFEQVLLLISDIKKNVVFMFDEFQQIANYPEKNMEPMLRSIIQTYPEIPFVFSGSSKHMLENMFMSPGRPFYQSSELMYLDRISVHDYGNFIRNCFGLNNREIDEESIAKIIDWTSLHTYYVQFVCNKLFGKNEKKISGDLVNNIFYEIITDFEPQYINYRNLLPPHQFRLLKAIAAEESLTQPMSGNFISKYSLTSASSVSTSLKALTEKEMIVFDRNRWYVYDVFFSRWLEYRYKEL